jgi:NitT/TauT family transport system substrate-binding protein
MSAVALALAAPLLAGCGSSTAPSGQPDASGSTEPAEIKVGVPATANSINAHLAAEKYFAEKGLKVEFVDVTSGAAAIPMLLNGQLDIAQGDGIGTLAASSNGVPIAIAGVATVQTDDPKLDVTGIFTADNSTKVADLSGNSFAVSQLGGAAELVAKAAIDAEGGDSSTVTFVELQAAQMAAALEAGRVAGALITEPFATAAEEAGLPVLIRPQAAGAPGLPATYWVTSVKYGQKNPEIVKGFLASVQQAGRDANEDPALARKTAAKYMDMDPKVLNAIRLPVFAEDVTDTSGVTKFVDLANRYKVLPKQPDIETLLSLKFEVAE